MRSLKIYLLALCFAFGVSSMGMAAEDPSKVQTQEVIGKIVSLDAKKSTFDLAYEINDQTHEMQTTTFYVTDISMIDIATVKGTLNDLKVGVSVLVEFAQMPDGTKVVDSVWVK